MPLRTARPAPARSALLTRSALSGALGALLAASAARAAPLGASIPAGVAKAPSVSTSGSTTSVTLNQSRTVIDWKSFSVAKGETLDFVFSSASGMVLNRTTGSATVNGALNGCVVTCNVIGGSVWIYAPNGVLFGPGARVNVGSLLATTTPLSNIAGFLAGGTDFSFQGGTGLGKVDVATGAQLAAHGGALALIAPEVDVEPGATVSAAQTTLLGAAQNFRIHFDESAGGDLDLVDFEVPTSALQDGSISATPLSVNGQVAGGSVVMAAVSRPSVLNALISLGGQVTATSAQAGAGGDIVLTASGAASTTKVEGALTASRSVSLGAPDGGALEISGSVLARDASGQGGTITLGGAGAGAVTLQAGSRVDASSTGAGLVGGAVAATAAELDVEGAVAAGGPSGGGSIRLGGGAHGADPTLADATATTIGARATIDASATTAGNGGQVVVWSNQDTEFAGTITARGGPLGGNGGSAEVSGGYLDYAGLTDLRAPLGATGALLLDPADINITLDSAAGTGSPNFTPGSASPSDLSVKAINKALLTSDVTVTAGAGGKITFIDEADASKTSQYSFAGVLGTNLSFTAPGGFTFDSKLPITASGLNLTFSTSGSSAFALGGGSISTGGGNLTIQAVGVSLGGGSLSSTGLLAAGKIDLEAGSGALTLDGKVDAGTSGAVTLAGAGVDQPDIIDNPAKKLVADVLNAGSLTLTATGTGSAGAISLASPDNRVSTLVSASGKSGLSLVTGEALTVSGTLNTGAADQITTTGGLSFPNAVTLNEDLGVTGGASFAKTLDGAHALSVAGGASFDGLVGGATPLTSISTDVATLDTTGVSASGDLDLGAATLKSDVTLTSGGTVTTTALDGKHDVTIMGAAAFSNVGASSAPTGLLVSGASTLNAGAIKVAGPISFQAVTLAGASSVTSTTDSIAFDGALGGDFDLTTTTSAAGAATRFTTTAGSQPLASLTVNGAAQTDGVLVANGAVMFKAAATLTGDTSVTSNAGSITFAGAVDGDAALTTIATTAGQTTSFQGVGQATPLTSLTTSGAVTADGSVSASGGIDFKGAVTLGKALTVASSAGSITFGGALDGDFDLTTSATAAGQTTSFANVGQNTALASLTTNGAVSTDGAITVDGAADFKNAVTVAGTSSVTSNAGSITFADAVDGPGALTTSATTAGQTTSFQGVGQATPLKSLTTSGAVTADGSVSTSGGIDFKGAVTLGKALTVASSAGSITFGGALDGDFDLTTSATAAGQTTSFANVGQKTVLASLVVNGAAQTNGAITVEGAADFKNAVTVAGTSSVTSDSGSITFADAVDGPGSLTTSATTAGQTTRFQGVGQTTALAGLTTSGAVTTNGGVKASGGIVFNNAVTLAGDTAVVSTGGSITFGSTVDGGFALGASTVSGQSSVFKGDLGQAVNLASLTVQGPATVGGLVTATGAVQFKGATTLTSNLSVKSVSGGVGFTGGLDGGFGFDATVAGGQTIALGAVGQSVALTSVAVHGAASVGGSITAKTAVAFDDAVTLAGDSTITSTASGITFEGAVDSAATGGPFVLTTSSAGGATTAFQAGVGQVHALGGLTTHGATTLDGFATATGNIAFDDGLTLLADAVIKSNPGSVSFGGPLEGAYNLTVSATTGGASFAGVGAGGALTSLTVQGPSTLHGDVFAGEIMLEGTTTLSHSGGGLVTLTSGSDVDVQAVQSDPANLTGLSVKASSGAFTATGAIGTGATALSSLGVTAQTASFVAGNDVKTLAVDLLAAGALSFDNGANALAIGTVGGVSGVTAVNSNITLTGGALTVGAPVASTTAPTLGGGDRLVLSGTSVTLGPAASLTASAVELDGSGTGGVVQQGGSITAPTLSGTSAGAITLNAGTNAIQALDGLKTTGTGAIAVTAAGPLSVASGGVQAGGALTLTLTQASAGLTLNGDVAGQAVALSAPGVIRQTAGKLTAASLTASGSAILLTDATNAVSQIAAGGLASSGAAPGAGDVRLTTASALAAAGPVAASNGAVVLRAASLSLGAVTADGDVDLTATGGALTLNGAVSGGATIVLSAAGAVSEAGGSLSADQASVSGQSVDLQGTNALNSLDTSSAMGGGFTVVNTKALTVGALTLSRDLTLTAGGVLTLTAAPTVPGDYSVKATRFAGDALSPVFTGANSNFTIEQTAGDLDLATIGAPTTPGALKVTLDAGSITDTSAGVLKGASFTASAQGLSLGNITTTSGGMTLTASPRGSNPATTPADIVLNGRLSAAGQGVVLSASAGAISEPGASSAGIAAGTLDAVAGKAISLPGQNLITVLTRLDGSTGASLRDLSSGVLPVSGAASGTGDLSISNTGGIELKTAISQAAGSVTLDAGAGAVSQDAGIAITAKTLDVTAEGIVLDLADNKVGEVALVDTGSSGVAFTNAATGLLTGDQLSSGGALTLATGGDLALTGAVSGGTVSLSAQGAVSQTAAGSIAATTLSVSGTKGVDLSTGSANSVGTLASLTDAPGDTAGVTFVGVSSRPMTVGLASNPSGTVAVDGGSGSVQLANTGGLTLVNDIHAGAATGARTVQLSAASGGIVEAGGAVTTGHLSVSAPGGAVDLRASGNGFSVIDGLTAGAGAQVFDTVAQLTVGPSLVAGGAVGLHNAGGGIALAGALNAAGQTVTLAADGGAVTQGAGDVITAAVLSAVGGGGVSLGQANVVSAASLLQDSGTSGAGVDFVSTQTLNVASAIGGAGGVTLSAGGDLKLTGTGVDASGHTASLTAGAGGISGAVSQDAGGVVKAAVLTGSALSGFDLSAADNVVPLVNGLSTQAGDLRLNDVTSLQLAGLVSAPQILLADTGTLSQASGGVLQTAMLTATATGGVTFDQANQIGEIVALQNTGAGGVVVNNASTSGLTVQTVDAGTGDLTISTQGAMSLTGHLAAGLSTGAQTISLSAKGELAQQSGASLTAGRVTGSSIGGFVLGQTSNAFAHAGPITTTGALTLADSAALTVDAALATTGGAVQIDPAALTLASTGSITSASLRVGAGGDIAIAGRLAIDGDASLNAGGAVGETGSIMAGSFGATASNGISLPTLKTAVLTGLSNTGSGDIDVQLVNAGPVASGQVTNTAGAVTILQPGGALAFNGAVSAKGLVTLTAGGALSGASIVSTTDAVLLTGAGVDVVNGGAGEVSAATDVTVQAGSGAASFYNLASGTGDVTVSAGGAIGVAGTLNVGRDLVLTGADYTGNVLAPVFAAGTGRDFLLTDTAGGLSFTSLAAPRNIVVTATDPGTGDSAPIVGGSITSTSGLISVMGTSIALSGPVSAATGGVTLDATAAGIGLSGLVNAGSSSAQLTAAGGVAESGGGAIQAASLSVSAGAAVSLGGANVVPTISDIANSGSGGVLFNSAAGATVVDSLSTAAGDIVLSAPGGALTLDSDLVSPGGIQILANGGLGAGALTAKGGDLTVAVQGVILTGAASATGNVRIDAGAGPASLKTVSAQAGNLTLLGGDMATGDLSAGQSVFVDAAGDASFGQVTAQAGSLSLTGAALSFTTATAATTAALQSGAGISFASLTSGGDLTATAGGALTAATLTSTGGAATLKVASLQLGSLSAGADLSATTTAGDLVASTVEAGGDAGLTSAGAVNVQQATAGGVLTVSAQGAVNLPQARSASASIDGASVTLGALKTTGAASLRSEVGDITADTLTIGGDAAVQSAGSALLGAVQVGGDLTGSAVGVFKIATLTVDGALQLSGASVDIGAATAGSTTSLSSTGDLSLTDLTAAGGLTLKAGGTITADTLKATSGDLSLTSGGDQTAQAISASGAATLSSGGSATFATLTAGGALSAMIHDALDVQTLTTGGDAAIAAQTLQLAQATVDGNATLAVGGDATLTAFSAGGALQAQIGGALGGPAAGQGSVSSGAGADITAASVNLAVLKAGGDLGLTTQGDATLGALNAGGVLNVQAGGALTAATLGAGSTADLAAQTLQLAQATVGRDATLAVGGDATLTAFSAGGALQAQIGGALGGPTAGQGSVSSGAGADIKAASVNLAVLKAGGDLALTTQGDATLGALTAGGGLDVHAGGALTAATLGAGSTASLTAQTLAIQSGVVGTDASLSTAGDLTATTLTTGGGFTATSGGRFTVQALTVGADGAIKAQGAISYATAQAGGGLSLASQTGDVTGASTRVGADLGVNAAGSASLTGIVTGAAGDVSITADRIAIGALSGAPGPADVLTTGAATTVELAATHQISVDVSGPAALTSVAAGGDLTLATTGGDLSAGTLSTGGAFSADAQGGSARFGVFSLAGGGPATIQASQDVVMGAGSGVAGASTLINIPTRLLTVAAGRDVMISYNDGVSLASVAAGRNLSIASTAGALDLPSLSAGGSAALSGTSLALGAATTGADLTAGASSGDARLDAATVGGDLSLTAAGGAAALRTVSMTAAQPGTRTLTVSATGEASIGAASDGAPGGALALSDPGLTHVYVLSTGSGGAQARVDVTGDATLAQVSSASGDVFVRTPGVLTGAPTDGVLFSAAGNLTASSGGAATLGGQSTIGGDASLSIGGALSLDALSARTVNLIATDLSLSGALKATQACSPSCPAPTLVIQSRNGPLALGDGATASGGMTIDNGEFGRIQADSAALYAGDAADASARGDLQVGDLTLNASAVKLLSLYAGPASTVRVSGVAAPTAAATGALVIGAADASTGWTPKSIYVTGALGTSGPTLTSTGMGLASVELNSVQDTLIGGPAFISAITAAEAGSNPAGTINITRGTPVGVQPTLAELDKNLITTGVLTLRSNGYVIAQNTGAIGQQGGIMLTNPTRQPYVLTLGRVSASTSSPLLLTPSLIDVSLNFYDAAGALITRNVAATSLGIDSSALSRSNIYRVNGCTIGIAGSCTPLPDTIVDIRIDKLVEGVQISTEESQSIDDPTITAAGNEEIWRSPDCDGPECR